LQTYKFFKSRTLISFILYRQLKISNANYLKETKIPVDTILYLSLSYLVTIWYTCLIRTSVFLTIQFLVILPILYTGNNKNLPSLLLGLKPMRRSQPKQLVH